jgi:hypothetical protein
VLRSQMRLVPQGSPSNNQQQQQQQQQTQTFRTRSASPLLRALEFNATTGQLVRSPSQAENLPIGAEYQSGAGSIPPEAASVMRRVRNAVLRSKHSRERVFRRFCRAAAEGPMPQMTWSDFVRVIGTFERELDEKVVSQLWNCLVPSCATGMDFHIYSEPFLHRRLFLTRRRRLQTFR